MAFEKSGVVSVWAGLFESEAELLDYIEWKYDDEGEATCAFADDIDLGWFDHDLQEAEFLGARPDSPDAALDGFSYIASFRQSLASSLSRELDPWNALFLLYDCHYEPDRAVSAPNARLRFIGALPYSKVGE